jgi:hypothetical protein
MNNNKPKSIKQNQNQPLQQHQEHQQQRTKHQHGSDKQDNQTLHGNVGYHEQELIATRMFD